MLTTWSKRATEINSGKAVLSLRQWSGKPYRSKQKEFLKLEKIGVQLITISKDNENYSCCYVESKYTKTGIIAQNDGLSELDFDNWFKKPLMQGCIIHFTENFRYD